VEKETITNLNKTFEESAYEQDGIEYWLARELQELLGYVEWRDCFKRPIRISTLISKIILRKTNSTKSKYLRVKAVFVRFERFHQPEVMLVK
jgi:hypothetical protein